MPSFLAPELQDYRPGAAPLPPSSAAKADSWSLGVLLFFLLSGELPFTLCTELKGKHLSRVKSRVCSATLVEPAAKALERMPAGVKHLLQNLLAIDPAKRLDTWQVRNVLFRNILQNLLAIDPAKRLDTWQVRNVLLWNILFVAASSRGGCGIYSYPAGRLCSGGSAERPST